jgi:hypothetical protein
MVAFRDLCHREISEKMLGSFDEFWLVLNEILNPEPYAANQFDSAECSGRMRPSNDVLKGFANAVKNI